MNLFWAFIEFQGSLCLGAYALRRSPRPKRFSEKKSKPRLRLIPGQRDIDW